MSKQLTFVNDPAFSRPGNDWHKEQDGLTKREYFAAMALQGISANSALYRLSIEEKAERAVLLADQVIAELNKDE